MNNSSWPPIPFDSIPYPRWEIDLTETSNTCTVKLVTFEPVRAYCTYCAEPLEQGVKCTACGAPQ